MPSGEHNQPQSGSNQGSAKKERKHWLEYGIFGFVVATTIGTGCAPWYSRQQWITAHDTMVVSERAFISFGSPKRIFPAHDPTKGDFIAVDMATLVSG